MSEHCHDHLISPEHCFCQVSKAKLIKWAYKRFVEKIPTIELLKLAQTKEEREIIGIVALLDVDEEQMLKMMGDVNKPEHHIIDCRVKVKKMVDKKLEDENGRKEE